MRKSLLAVAGCGLMLATLVTSLPAQAAPPTADCRVAGPAPALRAARAADGTPAYLQWLDTAPVRQANFAVQRAAQAALGVPDGKQRVSDTLRLGLIGSAIDHNTRTVTVVLTPEAGERAEEVGTRIAAMPSARDTAVAPTEVKVGCFSADRLIAADELLFARAWHPDAAAATFSYYLDAADSRYRVSFDPGYPEAAQALRDALGDVADVTLDGAGRTGRLNDGEPHFGGAGLRAGSGATNTCTSGFIARRSDGRIGGTTAGHCFSNGQSIYSSTQYWGAASGKTNYPAYDIMFVSSSAETYDNKIHSDPCCPTERFVTAKRNPVIGDSVCLSGMVTKATCGISVNSLQGVLCAADGCTYGLMQGNRGGDVIVKNGDSGGPVYIRTGTSNATAVAMIIGCSSGSCTSVLAEHLSSIESYLGVSVLTS
ncbi:hypothetical protein ACFQY4_09185 [Catellatospora bangladeshensis]|uniref:Uncharacterized protein n=1 Tax=Catellatospora bangladeshensis TaxID=310355 RepID=A0A8J3J809_9ACTN|nr:hypothetical protein [Catellatospora bangladeshensis]GIF79011.1 hypothetical protein Cba03nite_03600 [Catellatospora bangladeshensis]